MLPALLLLGAVVFGALVVLARQRMAVHPHNDYLRWLKKQSDAKRANRSGRPR